MAAGWIHPCLPNAALPRYEIGVNTLGVTEMEAVKLTTPVTATLPITLKRAGERQTIAHLTNREESWGREPRCYEL